MDSPVLFTVAEAAVVLRIGRTTAYELARRDLATEGGEGLGVVRIGGQLRIPRASLERMTGGLIDSPEAPGQPAEIVSPERSRTVRRHRSADVAAPTLPFPS